MHFDDRLATVLRSRAAGERSAATQFRQLIDLLGERPQAGDRSLRAAAYLRLIALGEQIPVRARAAIVAENGARLRNPELVKWFAGAAPEVAAAALFRARLDGAEWERLIPRLPLRARGFLRHRRDLPDEALRVLDILGVRDRALPMPELLDLTEEADDAPEAVDLSASLAAEADPTPDTRSAPPGDQNRPATAIERAAAQDPELDLGLAPLPPAPSAATQGTEISAIVARIEAFKRNRPARPPAPAREAIVADPVLPLAGLDSPPEPRPLTSFLFGTDAQGRIDWAEADVAPMVTGLDLAALPQAPGAPIESMAAFVNRHPLRDLPLVLRGATRIEGEWICDAAPRFSRGEGHFIGYIGRFRRAVASAEDQRAVEADKLRQLLHELRTPVNAMQGYAEVIQQQVFGPTPHEYRALAAAIAGDSARILAGFDELDRLARLETGALDLASGEADFARIARQQAAQLQTVLSPRVARFDADFGDEPALLGLAQNEAEMLAWRILATLAGAVGAGEKIALSLRADDGEAILRADLPLALRNAADIFSAETRVGGGSLSAGIFGAGFSLRLARAEAKAAGGTLGRQDDCLVLVLPLLTPASALPSPDRVTGRAAG